MWLYLRCPIYPVSWGRCASTGPSSPWRFAARWRQEEPIRTIAGTASPKPGQQEGRLVQEEQTGSPVGRHFQSLGHENKHKSFASFSGSFSFPFTQIVISLISTWVNQWIFMMHWWDYVLVKVWESAGNLNELMTVPKLWKPRKRLQLEWKVDSDTLWIIWEAKKKRIHRTEQYNFLSLWEWLPIIIRSRFLVMTLKMYFYFI